MSWNSLRLVMRICHLTGYYLTAKFAGWAGIADTAYTCIDRGDTFTSPAPTFFVFDATAADNRYSIAGNLIAAVRTAVKRCVCIRLAHDAAKTFAANVVLDPPGIQDLFFMLRGGGFMALDRAHIQTILPAQEFSCCLPSR
ncbi:TPA: hypothetical protein ACODIZ_003598 [Salmonella enterica subsp. enterica serovar Newport]